MDRTGAGLGVERQVEDCERLSKRMGGVVVNVYSDNDISAYTGKRRPEYERLLADMRAGKIDRVIAWHADRLHRSPRTLEEYIDTCEASKVSTLTVQGGELDLSSPSGRMVARMLGAAARAESEHKGERVRRARQQEAERGLAHNNRLGYG